MVSSQGPDSVELPAGLQACPSREELGAQAQPPSAQVNWAACQAKDSKVETTRLAHTQHIGGQATTPKASTQAKVPMAKAMVMAPAGHTVPDTETMSGALLAMATEAAMATVVATVVLSQLFPGTAASASHPLAAILGRLG